MIISHSKKFIFIHLEKCGGTSVESALESQLSPEDILIGSTDTGEALQDRYFNQYGTRYTKNNMLWKHSTARQIYKQIGRNEWKNYKKISIVRDPVDLAKSLYAFSEKVISYHTTGVDLKIWEKMVKRNHFPDKWPYYEDYVQAYMRSHVYGKKFDGFVMDLIKRDSDCFSPYSERLKPSYFDQDFGTVIDLSQLNSRWTSLCKEIKVPSVPLQKLNTSESNSLVISDFITGEIKKRFAIDYETIPQYTGVYWN